MKKGLRRINIDHAAAGSGWKADLMKRGLD